MILVRLKGGLGNQMFQYAIGRNLALKNNTKLKFDVIELEQNPFHNITLRSYELDIFNMSGRIASRYEMMFIDKFKKNTISKILGLNYVRVKQKDNYFDYSILKKKGNIYN